jgi:Apea-like HEPN
LKPIKDRKKELIKRFLTIQVCVGRGIDPTKHTVFAGGIILNIDSAVMTVVRTEVGKLLGCVEAANFSAQELEQLLLECAARNVKSGRGAQANATAALADFLTELPRRVRRFLVPFVIPGLRVENPPSGTHSITIGPCEICATADRLKQIFAGVRVPVRRQASAKHAFPTKGALIVPPDQTVAVVTVKTSSRFAAMEAQARLEEAYGFFVLHYDAVSGSLEPGGPLTRKPLISWQLHPALAPICAVATEPVDRDSSLRFSTGFDMLWHKGYDVDLSKAEPKLRGIDFFQRERELFGSYADTEMAVRIRAAFRWLARGLQARDPQTQFLDFAIALEAMFTAASSEYKISAIIRDSVSRVVAWPEPDKVRQLVSRLYGLRSGMVHQGSIAQFTQEISELYEIVVLCVWGLLAAGDHKDSYEKMLARLGIKLESYRQEPTVPVDTKSETCGFLAVINRIWQRLRRVEGTK